MDDILPNSYFIGLTVGYFGIHSGAWIDDDEAFQCGKEAGKRAKLAGLSFYKLVSGKVTE